MPVACLMNTGGGFPHDYILTGAKFCTEYVTTDECVVAAWYRYLQFTMVVLEEHQHQITIL
jgi:hypothetical protein